MNGKRTNSILERAPEILAVTAASYGLPAPTRAQAQAGRSDKDVVRRSTNTSDRARTVRETVPSAH
jgi:hypothetical protein